MWKGQQSPRKGTVSTVIAFSGKRSFHTISNSSLGHWRSREGEGYLGARQNPQVSLCALSALHAPEISFPFPRTTATQATALKPLLYCK